MFYDIFIVFFMQSHDSDTLAVVPKWAVLRVKFSVWVEFQVVVAIVFFFVAVCLLQSDPPRTHGI